MKINTLNQKKSFLSGGGEMGDLIRQKDWSKTSLGSPENWSQSLRTTLSIILNSKFPMFLFWGPELLCFYNDGYRPSLGNDGKHPHILGSKAEDFWQEIWSDIKPLIDNILAGGESNWNEDQLLPIYRNGDIEDVYWTFSYSPVNDETGKPGGVFVTCVETTKQVNAIKELEESQKKLQFAISAAELGTWDLNPQTNRFMYNQQLRYWFGLDPENEIDAPSAINAIVEKDRQKTIDAIAAATAQGSDGNYEIQHRVVSKFDGKERFLLTKGKALFDENGIANRISGTVQDITEQMIARKELVETKEQLEFTFANVPAAICLYGNNKQIIFANERAAKMLGYETVKEVLSYHNIDALMQKAGQDFYVANEINQPFTRENLPTSSSLKTGKLGDMVFSMQKKTGGTKTWYLSKLAPILDSKGSISMVLTTTTDITIQKNAEETIRESENRFRLFSDNAPMWVCVTDLEINILYANLEMLNYLGLSHYSQFTDKFWQQVVYPEDIIILLEIFQKSISEQITFDYELRIKNVKMGVYEWFYLKVIPRYENEKLIGFIGTGLNIHQQKTFAQTLESEVGERTAELKIANDMLFQRNDMLSVSESFNRNLTELSPNVVYIQDLEGNKNMFLNQTGLKLIGKSLEKIKEIGDQIQTLIIHPDDIDSVLETIEKVKKSKNEEVFEHEYRVKNAEGNWTPILARDTAFKRNEKKEVIQLLGIAIDITEIKKSKNVLEQKNRELEKMNKELESFAYVSSHDLQEPLRKIQAFSSRLMEKENENLSETGKDYLRRMRLAGERMQQLIQDLLAYSRTKTTERKFEKIALTTIIADVIDDLKEDLTLKNGNIIIRDVCDLNIIPFQFRQLIYNLISNSIKFAKTDLPPIIKIDCKNVEGKYLNNDKSSSELDYCHISISDNGIGFDDNYKDKIFEIFQRLHGREEYMGTGIGLAIVKKIVENHNGFISANGEPNKGATFNIYIPV
jgi:PAS domain S-box-containing protein